MNFLFPFSHYVFRVDPGDHLVEWLSYRWRLKTFLSFGGFPKEERASLCAAAVAELTLSVSLVDCHFFHNGPSFRHEQICRKARLPLWLLWKSCHPFTHRIRLRKGSIASALHFVCDL